MERANGRGEVAGALRGDAEVVLPREVDHRDHVGHGLGHGDCGGSLVRCEVPRAPRLVPAFVSRGQAPPRSSARAARERQPGLLLPSELRYSSVLLGGVLVGGSGALQHDASCDRGPATRPNVRKTAPARVPVVSARPSEAAEAASGRESRLRALRLAQRADHVTLDGSREEALVGEQLLEQAWLHGEDRRPLASGGRRRRGPADDQPRVAEPRPGPASATRMALPPRRIASSTAPFSVTKAAREPRPPRPARHRAVPARPAPRRADRPARSGRSHGRTAAARGSRAAEARRVLRPRSALDALAGERGREGDVALAQPAAGQRRQLAPHRARSGIPAAEQPEELAAREPQHLRRLERTNGRRADAAVEQREFAHHRTRAEPGQLDLPPPGSRAATATLPVSTTKSSSAGSPCRQSSSPGARLSPPRPAA